MQSKKAVCTIYGQKVAWAVYVGGMGAVLEWSFIRGKKTSSAGNGFQGGRLLKGREIDDATRALGGSHFGIEAIIQAEIDANIEKCQGPISAADRAALKFTANELI